MSKLCCTCKFEKDCFYRNKLSKDGLSAQCKDCSKKYREEHSNTEYPSNSKEYKINYIKDNIDSINKNRRIRYQNNKSNMKEANKLNYQNNKIERRIAQSIYYYNNTEYFRNKNKKYRINNKDYILLKNRKRQKDISTSNIKQNDINNLLINNDNACFYCFCKVVRGINLHLDHKIPLSSGGSHSIDNLVPACKTCNLRKGTKTSEEYIEYMNNIKGIQCQ